MMYLSLSWNVLSSISSMFSSQRNEESFLNFAQ